MRPQSINCGNFWGGNYLRTQIHSFNEAAVYQLRKLCWEWVGNSPSFEPSMRPQSINCGNCVTSPDKGSYQQAFNEAAVYQLRKFRWV